MTCDEKQQQARRYIALLALNGFSLSEATTEAVRLFDMNIQEAAALARSLED